MYKRQIIDYLDEFVKEGKIKFPAVSNWSAKRIAEANAYAARAGKTPIAMSQIQWSLASTTKEQYGDPTMETMTKEEYHWYRESGMIDGRYPSDHYPVIATLSLQDVYKRQGIY